MLQRLKWRPLSNRRKDARLMMVNYKWIYILGLPCG
jgi:hypothetical protein